MTARVIATVATARDHLDRGRRATEPIPANARGHDLLAGRHVDRPFIRHPPSIATKRSCASSTRRLPAPTFDLFAGDLLLFDGLGFKAVTPYRAVDGKRYAFALRPAGMTQAKPLSSNTEDLKDGDFYTAFAMPGDGHGPHLRIVSDHLDSPASGKARLRVVHAGVDAGKIDLRAAGATDVLFDDVEYQSVTDYRDVAPLNGADCRSSATDSPRPLLATINAHLEAGRFYTLVIVGNAALADQGWRHS